jgi:Mor family transcriptional regulator
MKLRNEKICELYATGIPLAELAELYSLSEERIRNIVYGQQRD